VGQDGEVIKVIWVFGKSEYFCERGWTADSVICPSGQANIALEFFVWSRRGVSADCPHCRKLLTLIARVTGDLGWSTIGKREKNLPFAWAIGDDPDQTLLLGAAHAYIYQHYRA
jgi:hypothetical protein